MAKATVARRRKTQLSSKQRRDIIIKANELVLAMLGSKPRGDIAIGLEVLNALLTLSVEQG
jgi:hypothetical protein